MPDWIQIVTIFIALYGAVLSTVIFIVKRKENQRQLAIKISNGFLPILDDVGELLLFIEIYNPGNRTVLIQPPWIVLPDRKTLVFPNPQSNVTFPYMLQEGSNCRIWIEMKVLTNQLKREGYTGKIKIKAGVRDGAGKEYISKKTWKINLG